MRAVRVVRREPCKVIRRSPGPPEQTSGQSMKGQVMAICDLPAQDQARRTVLRYGRRRPDLARRNSHPPAGYPRDQATYVIPEPTGPAPGISAVTFGGTAPAQL
jgi:hypothetical protein